MILKIDENKFYPKESLDEYLDSKKVILLEWYEEISPKEKEAALKYLLDHPEIKSSEIWSGAFFQYPVIEDNIYLYHKLTETREFRGLFEPLSFFNLLYEQFKIILDNTYDNERIVNLLLKLPLSKKQLHFFLYSLHYIINGLNGPLDNDNEIGLDAEGNVSENYMLPGISENLSFTHSLIIDEYKRLEKELGIDTGSPYEKNQRSISTELNILPRTLKERLRIKQIALIHVYNKEQITRENGSEIAKRHGYYSANSGEKLYQYYTYFINNANRKAIPDTKKTRLNKVELFESILEQLEEKHKQLALDEIKLLKTYITDKDL